MSLLRSSTEARDMKRPDPDPENHEARQAQPHHNTDSSDDDSKSNSRHDKRKSHAERQNPQREIGCGILRGLVAAVVSALVGIGFDQAGFEQA
nr:hypothetical protein B0A51_03690 [Rachicladosporium sp. CCFEE 5018]